MNAVYGGWVGSGRSSRGGPAVRSAGVTVQKINKIRTPKEDWCTRTSRGQKVITSLAEPIIATSTFLVGSDGSCDRLDVSAVGI